MINGSKNLLLTCKFFETCKKKFRSQHTNFFVTEGGTAPNLSQIRTFKLAGLDIARPGPDQTINCHEIFPHGNRCGFYFLHFKAMDQLNHTTSVIAITVCKVIRKIITKMDFRYETDKKNTENLF